MSIADKVIINILHYGYSHPMLSLCIIGAVVVGTLVYKWRG